MKNYSIATSRKYMPYTVKEDKMLRDGATSLPGRTPKAVYQRRRELGLVKPSKWTPDEIELAKRNIVPSGRTKAALRCLRNKLGLTKAVGEAANGQTFHEAHFRHRRTVCTYRQHPFQEWHDRQGNCRTDWQEPFDSPDGIGSFRCSPYEIIFDFPIEGGSGASRVPIF